MQDQGAPGRCIAIATASGPFSESLQLSHRRVDYGLRLARSSVLQVSVSPHLIHYFVWVIFLKMNLFQRVREGEIESGKSGCSCSSVGSLPSWLRTTRAGSCWFHEPGSLGCPLRIADVQTFGSPSAGRPRPLAVSWIEVKLPGHILLSMWGAWHYKHYYNTSSRSWLVLCISLAAKILNVWDCSPVMKLCYLMFDMFTCIFWDLGKTRTCLEHLSSAICSLWDYRITFTC